MWRRSEIDGHRALLIGIPPVHAVLSPAPQRDRWVLTTRRGTRAGALWEVLRRWPVPADRDLAWVGG